MRCARVRARFHFRQQCSNGIFILGKQLRNLLNLTVHATEITPVLQLQLFCSCDGDVPAVWSNMGQRLSTFDNIVLT